MEFWRHLQINLTNEELGKLLLEEQFITQRQLDKAFVRTEQTGEPLLVSLGFVTERELVEATGRKIGVPFVDLDSISLDPEMAALIPEHLAVRYRALPIGQQGDRLTVAMSFPLNAIALDDIRLITGFNLDPVLVTESAMARALKRMFNLEGFSDQDDLSPDRLKELVDETPIVRVVNLIVSQAVNDGATAIHLEKGLVRYRCDGVLFEVMNPPDSVHAAVVARLKIMANMDVAERRIPQDGMIRLTHDGTAYDVRVTTLPCEGGEKVILRIFPVDAAAVPDLGNLGLSSRNLANLEALLQRRAGLLVVTGGSRSGKATFLYSCLRTLNQAPKCIYSIADPYHFHLKLPWVNHIQLNSKAGLSFESAIASCLRSDPDVLLIGSLDSTWQAQMAMDAAGRGCLVLAAMHGSGAAQGLVSLVNWGLEPYLLGRALLGILHQRLARRICPDCRKSVPAPPDVSTSPISVGAGCLNCRSSGCRGQVGIQELLQNNAPIAELLLTRPSARELHDLSCKHGMVPMREDALEKVRQGLISLDEMLRVLRD